ncbi:MAG TPA: ABC transporter permease [bacterium]|jgi:ABC-2 type transport system permease protein|nr:ABC transporter permease [bacterium]
MSLRKIRVVAATEFFHLLKTKVFLLSLILVPSLSLSLGYAWNYLEKRPDQAQRRVGVLDRSGVLLEALKTESLQKSGARYEILTVPGVGQSPAQTRAAALDRVRRGDLFAVLEIPPHPFATRGDGASFAYYSATPSYGDLPAWLSEVLNNEIRMRRYRSLGLSDSAVRATEKHVPVEEYRVVQRAGASPDDQVAAVEPSEFLVPVGSMLLLFLMVMLTAPQMMSSVIEEKMSRISEVLLASVTPFDLMVGKLAACCGASTVVGALYLAIGLALAKHLGYSAMISVENVLYFFVFLLLAVFLHGSLYMAVGAACSQPKDAQGMLAPLVLVTAAPMVALNALMQDPSGALATGLSFFPLSAPFVLCFRLNSHPGPSLGETALSIAVTLAATLACVWAASRIFRIGLLSQGKAPGPLQLFRWVFSD